MMSAVTGRAGGVLVAAGLLLLLCGEKVPPEAEGVPGSALSVMTFTVDGTGPVPLIQVSLHGAEGTPVYSLYPERDGEGPLKVERLLGEKRGGIHVRV